MSRQVRQRVTAIVLGGLIFGAPMLANGTASADPVPEGVRQVTFTGGGMFGIACRSRPSVESMTVPAQSTIRVVNETGHAADLLLGGESKGTLPDDGSTEVIFRRGTTSVTVKPSCAIGDEAEPVMITASPSAAATTMPDPAPAAPSDDAKPMSLAPSGPGDSSGVPSGSKAAAVERPDRDKTATTRPSTRKPAVLRHSAVSQAATAAAQAMPHGGAAPETKTKTGAGTPDSVTPAFAGMPVGNERKLLPGVPQLDVEPVTIDPVPVAPPAPPVQIAAAEPVSALQPLPEGGNPFGLLALIAAVCVVGVTVAAIRSIVSQRANRARLA
ncbi:hypothetical protein [Paractinoplanes brasiliensis]|uniref:Uncharacterized protein n=1 Tax=Paractinoplanes brasiliensis TaxID=52695 RepID=A0A4R6JSE2_9ACTN|nr:hypothetical protein [Actinoplanes brasiliensis]TDO39510.1 hypothetical protein C8E87_3201 [Actinoplanes brasiliensis]GID29152.1 hypothetical protein Abr02nite_41350 [Actinoplanes brasiliensis]